MSKLVVVGSVNADHVLRVPRFPQPGETLTGRQYQVISGGKGANQAMAAARLGADLAFIACVGDDAFGLNTIAQFQEAGVDTAHMRVQPNQPTGIAMIQVSDSGENAICLSPESNAALSADLINQASDVIHAAEYLLIQLETPLDGVVAAVELAQINETKVVLNPAPAVPLSDTLLQHVYMITPNETEAEVLTGVKVTDDTTAQYAANQLHAKGIKLVVITLGSRGAWVSDDGQGKLISGFIVDAVDTTAAGDTFNAGLVMALMEGKPLESAMRFAQAAAALSVTRFGAQSSIPTRKEVDQFLG